MFFSSSLDETLEAGTVHEDGRKLLGMKGLGAELPQNKD
jgi:hypothetical protein